MPVLDIKDLYASVETKEGRKQILKGVSLTLNSDETHAIMGPNGSGKSTLAYTLAGHPKYIVDSGQALLDGRDLLKMTPDERAVPGHAVSGGGTGGLYDQFLEDRQDCY